MNINVHEIMVYNNKFGVKAEKYNNKNQHITGLQNIDANTTLNSMDLMSRNNVSFGMCKLKTESRIQKVLQYIKKELPVLLGAVGASVVAFANKLFNKETNEIPEDCVMTRNTEKLPNEENTLKDEYESPDMHIIDINNSEPFYCTEETNRQNHTSLWSRLFGADRTKSTESEPLIKELSDEKFKRMKATLLRKTRDFDALKIDQTQINKYNCQVLKTIINNSKLLENKKFANLVNGIIYDSVELESARAKKSMIVEMARIQRKNLELWNILDSEINIGEFICDIETPKQASSIKSMIAEIERIQRKNPKLWNILKNYTKSVEVKRIRSNSRNIHYMKNNVNKIIYTSDTQEQASSIKSMIAEIERIQNDNPKLFDIIKKDIGNIIYSSNTQEAAGSIKSMIAEIERIQNDNPKLFDIIKEKVCDIIYSSNTKEAESSRKLMIAEIERIQKDNPKLFDIIKEKVCDIIYSSNTQEQAISRKLMIAEVERIQKDNPKLFDILYSKIGIDKFIRYTNTQEQASLRKSMIAEVERIQKDNPELFNDKNSAGNVLDIIYNAVVLHQESIGLEALKHQEILTDKNLTDIVANMFNQCAYNDAGIANIAIKALQHPERLKNENYAHTVINMIKGESDCVRELSDSIGKVKNYSPEFSLKALDYPELCMNKSFSDSIESIAKLNYLAECLELRTSMMRQLAQIQQNNPEQFKFLEDYVGNIIHLAFDPRYVKEIDEMLADKDYSNLGEKISRII